MNKGLINVHIIKLSIYKNDRPQGIVSNFVNMIRSKF